MRRLRSLGAVVAASALLLGCASVYNEPVNVPVGPGGPTDTLSLNVADPAAMDDLLIGLSFSGGGTRAAAYSFGVLQEMDNVTMPRSAAKMIARLDFISGVSG